MSVHSVMRSLRKNKTLRYGVPMLVSAGRRTCGAGFRKGRASRSAGSRRPGSGRLEAGGREQQPGRGGGWWEVAVLGLSFR